MPDTNAPGPWDHPPTPPGGRGRLALWLAAVVGGVVALWLLFRLFPQQHDQWDWSNLIWLVAILAASSTSILAARRFSAKETFRNIAIWVSVAAVLAIGYTYRSELSSVAGRVQNEFSGVSETGPHELTLTRSDDGSFYVYGEVDGTTVKFLIDTGASDIVLSPDDARRAGIDMASLRYERSYETANGRVGGAPVTLGLLTVGPIHLSNVRASVNRAEMRSSLLGLEFLRRLNGFEVHGDRMILRGRGGAR